MAPLYKPLPPAELLWDLFELDPFTGTLYRKKHRNKNRLNKPFGCVFTNGYIVGEINSEKFQAHRLVWKWVHGSDPQEVDHVDRNRTNNSPWNLRSGTRSANHCNRGNVKGYTRTPSGTYRALIGIDGVQYYLGHYATEEQAREAYLAAAHLIHGKYTPEKGIACNVLEKLKRFHAKQHPRLSSQPPQQKAHSG
jgi:hypothetical protein